MKRSLKGLFFTGMLTLSGCAFLEQVERNRVMWNGYVNSPAYHQTIHTTTFETAAGTTHCTTICDKYNCVVRCY